MKPRPSSKLSLSSPSGLNPFPWKKIAGQAWNLFVFSSFFAVFFNAFFVGGIELKFKPKIFTDQAGQPSVPVTYEGFTSPSRTPSLKKAAPTPLPGEPDPFPRLSVMGVKQRFDKKSCVILDARKPEEYEAGHIPGALNFYGNEPEKFAPLVMPQLPDKSREIIAYCHGGDCDLSLQVAKALREAGYSHVEIFTGGWPDWQKAGYPITQGAEP